MLNDPNEMPELKNRKKVSMTQKPLPKFKSASEAFLTPQKTPKKRK